MKKNKTKQKHELNFHKEMVDFTSVMFWDCDQVNYSRKVHPMKLDIRFKKIKKSVMLLM